uniref:PDZ domain-containing protein n=1 Tax=Macrostomum lignano TaxID=282301 RepID=A0A1I8H9H8_9PLAT
MSLTNWVRSARCRLARLRRSFSASRVDAAAATKSTSMLSGSDAPTPKRLFASRKRHASLQRLVQRLAASPAGGPTVTSAKKISSPRGSGTASSVGTSSPMAVSGRVLKLLPDGSVYLSRFNDPATQRRYRSVLGVGDEILEIEDMPTTAMPLDDLHRLISDKRSLLIRVRSCYAW